MRDVGARKSTFDVVIGANAMVPTRSTRHVPGETLSMQALAPLCLSFASSHLSLSVAFAWNRTRRSEEGPLRRRARGATTERGEGGRSHVLRPKTSNPRRNVNSVCPSDDVLDRTTTAVARLPFRGEARRARGFASQPLNWFALVGSSFGAREHTFEIAFAPIARAIYRRKYSVFRVCALRSHVHWKQRPEKKCHADIRHGRTKSALCTSSLAGASASGE